MKFVPQRQRYFKVASGALHCTVPYLILHQCTVLHGTRLTCLCVTSPRSVHAYRTPLSHARADTQHTLTTPDATGWVAACHDKPGDEVRVRDTPRVCCHDTRCGSVHQVNLQGQTGRQPPVGLPCTSTSSLLVCFRPRPAPPSNACSPRCGL